MICLLAVPVLLSGCTTGALWQRDEFGATRKSAMPPNLEVHQTATKHTLLVAYDEANDKNNAIHRRLYWLNPDRKPVNNPHQPRFVRDGAQRKLTPIPVLVLADAQPATNSTCVVCADGQHFTIFANGKECGPFELPVYSDKAGRVQRILLTPLTLAADATVIGGLIFLVWWSEGGWSALNCALNN